MQHTLEMEHDENKDMGQEEGNGKLSSLADVMHSLSNCELQYVIWGRERRGAGSRETQPAAGCDGACVWLGLGKGGRYLNLRVQVSDSSIDIGLPLFPRSGIAGDHRIHME
jgi:hypothetical protein